MIKLGLVGAWLTLLLGTVGGLFWYNDWVFRLPTPIPVNYHPVATGTKIDLGDALPLSPEKPLFLHFYNPDCPCSRFNKSHFQSLVRKYGDDVQFVVVVMSDKKFTEANIQDKLGLALPVVFDQSVATRCGVYSTPQAAILDKQQKLYYRGNYNSSRYCTEEKSAYAKIALTSLLNRENLPVMTAQALRSYGCSLPVCKN